MARIAGIDLPKNKRGVIGLTYIYGIGRSTARKVLVAAKIDESVKVQDWDDTQLGAIRTALEEFKVEGSLKARNAFLKMFLNSSGALGLRYIPSIAEL